MDLQEKIIKIMEIANVDEASAKNALLYANNDLVDALLYIRNNNEALQTESTPETNKAFKLNLESILNPTLIIKKDKAIKLPLVIFALLLVFLPRLTLLISIILMFLGHKFQIINFYFENQLNIGIRFLQTLIEKTIYFFKENGYGNK
ncbi:MAG: hypothetical protein SPL05_06310 [Eubacteriales bacterium]|nr:hypothetical protein [Eubacteriales bacterium]